MSPVAEYDVTAAFIDRMVRAQHPDLAAPVRVIASGWDNVVARLGDDLLVRMPRRALAAPLIAHELACLPAIARLLPVAVPEPVRAGAPAGEYPWAWLIARWLPGDPVTAVATTRRGDVAADLGAAHAVLHVPAPDDAPPNPYRGVPLAERAGAAGTRLAAMPRGDELRPHWHRALAAPAWGGPPVWLHGDPHPGNLLAVDGRLAAIIDWGDVTAGDPASDLAVAWLAFDAVGRQAYRAALGAVDEATWTRAHGWAILLAGAFLESDATDATMREIGLHTIEQVLTDPPA